MTDRSALIDKGIGELNAASTLDKQGNLQGALDKYRAGLGYLFVVYKYSHNPKQKQMIHGKMQPFLERAEQIVEKLHKGSHKKETEGDQDENLESLKKGSCRNCGGGEFGSEVE